MNFVHCTLYNVHYMMYTVHCTVHYTAYSVRTMYAVHRIHVIYQLYSRHTARSCDSGCRAVNRVCNVETNTCKCRDGFVGVRCETGYVTARDVIPLRNPATKRYSYKLVTIVTKS